MTTIQTNLALSTTGTPAIAELAGRGRIEGLEALGQRDYILPRWSLVQPTSRRDGADEHVGQFVRNIDGEFRPYLDTVILRVSPTRILWSGDPSETQPECVSRDGITGSVYGACASCQFNPSANPALLQEIAAARREGRLPLHKVCNYGYTFVLVDDLESGSVALLGAMGTSVRPAKTLNTQFLMRRRPPYSAIVRWEAVRQTNERGKFYVLQPSIRQWLDSEATARWRELYQAIAAAAVTDVPEDTDAEDEPLF
jgi:hypothetical protein